ncbi:hypothetical protein Hanom_Chr12g01159341 [Helianthus anomalus]
MTLGFRRMNLCVCENRTCNNFLCVCVRIEPATTSSKKWRRIEPQISKHQRESNLQQHRCVAALMTLGFRRMMCGDVDEHRPPYQL